MHKKTAIMLLLLASLIWGASFIAVKSLLSYISINYILAVRFLAGTLALSVIFIKNRKDFTPKLFFRGALVGLVLYLAFMFQTWGLKYITSGKNALITALYVVIVPFLMWGFKKKRPNLRTILAAFICFAGVGVLSSVSDVDSSMNITLELFGLSLSGRGLELFGIVLTSISGVLFAVHIAIVAIYSEEHDVMNITFLQFLFAALFAFIAASLLETFPPLLEFDSSVWLSLGYICILSTVVALSLQNIGVKHAPPELASLVLCLESVFGCALGIIILKEKLTTAVIFGSILILLSIIVSEYQPRKRRG
ncbi:MAG: DMT family transporter [Clostridiales bacterium]|jgi:drug/metabolite transporter (DMT)-like permease|nr:DMT family transporter [Clostridiales bacterium]